MTGCSPIDSFFRASTRCWIAYGIRLDSNGTTIHGAHRLADIEAERKMPVT